MKEMSERYCPSCRADVEDVGGFCLLGHSLKLQPVTDPLRALRAEVDRVFEDARVQVATATGEMPALLAAAAPPPPPPPAPSHTPPASRSHLDEVYAGLDEDSSALDPITAFAPNTRMDWGPSESRLKRFRR